MALSHKAEGIKALLHRLESERGQVVRPDRELRLDLPVWLRPEDMFRLEKLAAYYDVPKRELASELLAAALIRARDVSEAELDDLEEQDYVNAQAEKDYWTSKLQAMRQGWVADAAENVPDQRREKDAPDQREE